MNNQSGLLPVFFLSFIILTLTSCARGPDEAQLTKELQHRLNRDFSEGLFKIRNLKRTGSAPYTDMDSSVPGVFVYYDAELEFLRDYSLTSWQGLNLGTLTYVIGANKSGIEGVKPDTNHKGDILRFYGRLSFSDHEGQWQTVTKKMPQTSGKASTPLMLEGSGPSAVLQNIRNLLKREPKVKRGTQDAAIVRELQLTVSRIDLIFAKLEGFLTFSTGQAPGTYYDFGSVFSEYATEHELPLHNYASGGSIENVIRLNNNLVNFALIQSDVAETIYKGWTKEHQLPNPDLRSMASLWPEAVHLVTIEKSGITSLMDLAGKRVAVGNPGSGSKFNAIRIGKAAGFDKNVFPEFMELGLMESIDALETGEVDAIFATEAVPSTALQELAGRRNDLRFISLDQDLVRNLSGSQFAYYSLTIPQLSYPGQEYPIHTLGLAALLITNKRTPDHDVERVLQMIVDSTDDLSKKYYRAGFISSDTMRLGVAVPLHPGAIQFYNRQRLKNNAEP